MRMLKSNATVCLQVAIYVISHTTMLYMAYGQEIKGAEVMMEESISHPVAKTTIEDIYLICISTVEKTVTRT